MPRLSSGLEYWIRAGRPFFQDASAAACSSLSVVDVVVAVAGLAETAPPLSVFCWAATGEVNASSAVSAIANRNVSFMIVSFCLMLALFRESPMLTPT
jgi:hypothetical protein